MKKFIAILLSLILALALCSTAFAANVMINSSDVFNGYKLLNLAVGLKNGDHPAACDGNKHVEDCYNYAYTVNDKYRSILQNETFTYGKDGLGDTAEAGKVTDQQILEYLSKQSGGTFTGTLRDVADRLYRAILAEGISADEKNLTKESTITEGYWLFADVTNEENHVKSLVIVDTKGASDITITPKVDFPVVEKKVRDINDSNDNNIADNAWLDSADHDIGDDVPFKLTATLPSNATFFESYKLVFHDTLSAGLTLDSDSIQVWMYANKEDADKNANGTDVTSSFVKTTSGLTDNCTFEVSCENVLDIQGVTNQTAFVVYYNAKLNADAVIGADGNPNKVYLEYSNNPYGNGTGKTEEDKVIVFTFKLVINKTDAQKNALKGAGFKLYKKNSAGTYEIIGTELKGDEMTTFEWKGLDDGDYKLEESTVPAGYNKMEDIEFTISATHDENSDEPKLLTLDGGEMGTGVVTSGTITKDIENHTGTVLPETGAKGTVMLISCSSVAVIMAAVFMITRKKMSVYED